MNKPIMLIVDDLEVNRAYLGVAFSDEFTPVYMKHGREAMNFIEQCDEKIAIILLDIVMPVMDGIAFLKWISKSEYTDIPIVVITAEPEYQLEAIENGAWDFVAKASEPDVIKARVHFVLNRWRFLREQKYIAELENTRRQMNHLVNSIPGGIAIYKMTDRFETLYFSDGVARLTGHTREEYMQCVGNNAMDIVYITDQKRLTEATENMFRNGTPIDILYRIYHKDGQLIWVQLSGLPMKKTADEMIIYAVFQSVSKQSKLYQKLLDESESAIYACDVETYEMIYFNHQAEHFAGLDSTKITGKKCYEVLFERSEPCPFCHIKSMTKDSVSEREFLYPRNGCTYRMNGKLMAWNGILVHVEYIEDITEKKATQKQNEALMEQLNSVMNNVPGAFCLYRFDGEKIQPIVHNKAFYEVLGYSETNIASVNRQMEFLNVYPGALPLLQKKAMNTFKEGSSMQHTYRFFHDKKGCYIWIRLDARVVPQADGSKLAYCSYTDVTSEKEAERIAIAAKDRAEQLYRQQMFIIESESGEGLLSKGYCNLTQDRLATYIKVSEDAVPILPGTKFDTIIEQLASHIQGQKQQQEILSSVSREKLISKFQMGISETTIEYQRAHTGSTMLWVSTVFRTIMEPDTNEILCFMYDYDITERIIQRRIVDHMTEMEYDFLAVVDVDGRSVTIRDAKREFQRLSATESFDYDKKCVLGMREHIVPEEREAVTEKLALDYVIHQLDESDSYFLTYSARNAKGQSCRKKIQYCYLDATRQSILLTLTDITQMYQQEQDHVKKLSAALAAAKAASSAKTEFFSRMSHDMRTPMNGILGVASLSQDENDPEVLKKNIEKIRESGQYLLGLINDTLDFQRIESGKLILEPKIISTRETVGNIIDMIRQTAEAKGVTLIVTQGNVDLDWYVRADVMRLKQIFINLLSNAIKFTAPGGRVQFEFRLLSQEGMVSHNAIIIRDTGIGMSKDFLENGIFNPFSQECNSVTSQYAGSGLGLSIAKRLVELMGGHIEVKSELGIGSEFTVYLDFERVDPREADQANSKGELHRDSVFTFLAGRTILLVEDHPLNAEIAKKLLEKAGCDVVWAQNGKEGISSFQESQVDGFDLILMDIRMPVMNGLEAARAIRLLQRADAKKIPIIAMTANAYEEDVQQSIDAGMNDHMAKPVEPAVMYQMLVRHIVQAE